MATRKKKRGKATTGWCVYSGKTPVSCHRLKRTAQKAARRAKAQGRKARIIKRK